MWNKCCQIEWLTSWISAFKVVLTFWEHKHFCAFLFFGSPSTSLLTAHGIHEVRVKDERWGNLWGWWVWDWAARHCGIWSGSWTPSRPMFAPSSCCCLCSSHCGNETPPRCICLCLWTSEWTSWTPEAKFQTIAEMTFKMQNVTHGFPFLSQTLLNHNLLGFLGDRYWHCKEALQLAAFWHLISFTF